MTGSPRVHAAALAALSLIIGVVVVFWQYPRLIVYLLLAAVAILAYSALYLVLAARLDPLERPRSERAEAAPPVSSERRRMRAGAEAPTAAAAEEER